MRLVLDTSVFVAGLRSDAGASRQLLLGALNRKFVLIASIPLFVEYQAVATRLEHLKAAQLSREDVEEILDAFAAVVEPVEFAFLWRPQLRDPDDDMVLETAANGRADAIVTFNLRDFGVVASRFGVALLSPGEALRRIEA